MEKEAVRSGSDPEEFSLSEDGSDEEASSSGSESGEDDKESLTFEQLEALRRDGGLSHQAMKSLLRKQKEKEKNRSFKRENKNRPMEMSSKRPVPRLREVVQVTKKETRDPRFDSLSGALQPDRFRKQYAFLYDEQLPAEREELKATLQKAKAVDKKKELQAQLTRVQQQIQEERSRRRKEAWEAEQKKNEREAVKAGKGVFFQKRSEKKRQELIRRYQELKATGHLAKVMAKRQKRNAAKDHRYVPSTRRQTD
ncbi:g3801 [Coccomyxa elongata]